MPWHLLSDRVSAVLKAYADGNIVADIGAGDLSHSRTLSELGAKEVIAIDPGLPTHEQVPENVTCIKNYVKEVPVPENLDVVFLAWPVNREIPGIESWLEKARVVVYFGCNDDYTVCGDKILWNLLSKRMVLRQESDNRATLIVYGKPLKDPREPIQEEKRAFAVWGWGVEIHHGRRGDLPKKKKPSGF